MLPVCIAIGFWAVEWWICSWGGGVTSCHGCRYHWSASPILCGSSSLLLVGTEWWWVFEGSVSFPSFTVHSSFHSHLFDGSAHFQSWWGFSCYSSCLSHWLTLNFSSYLQLPELYNSFASAKLTSLNTSWIFHTFPSSFCTCSSNS